MLITRFDVCTGPRNKDCTFLNATILGGGNLNVDVKVKENCNPSKVSNYNLMERHNLFWHCSFSTTRNPRVDSFKSSLAYQSLLTQSIKNVGK